MKEGDEQIGGSVTFWGKRSRAPAGLVPRSKSRPGIQRLWCLFGAQSVKPLTCPEVPGAFSASGLSAMLVTSLGRGGLVQRSQLCTPRFFHPGGQ